MDVDIDTTYQYLESPVSLLLMCCVFLLLLKFIICEGLCFHHPSEDTEHSHHHKDS